MASSEKDQKLKNTLILTLRPIVSSPPSPRHVLPILSTRPSPARTLSLTHGTSMPCHRPLRTSHPSKEPLQSPIQHVTRSPRQRAGGLDEAYGEIRIGITEREHPGRIWKQCWEKEGGNGREMR